MITITTRSCASVARHGAKAIVTPFCDALKLHQEEFSSSLPTPFRIVIDDEIRVFRHNPPMVAESDSPVSRPLSRNAALAGTDRNGRAAVKAECEGVAVSGLSGFSKRRRPSSGSFTVCLAQRGREGNSKARIRRQGCAMGAACGAGVVA
jgi:hypothetical protein